MTHPRQQPQEQYYISWTICFCRTLDFICHWISWNKEMSLDTNQRHVSFQWACKTGEVYLSTAVFTLVAITHSSPQAERTVTWNYWILYLMTWFNECNRELMTIIEYPKQNVSIIKVFFGTLSTVRFHVHTTHPW